MEQVFVIAIGLALIALEWLWSVILWLFHHIHYFLGAFFLLWLYIAVDQICRSVQSINRRLAAVEAQLEALQRRRDW